MDDTTIIAAASIISAGLTMGIVPWARVGTGTCCGRCVKRVGPTARCRLDHHADSVCGTGHDRVNGDLCFVISMILIFANPFWNHVITQVVGK